MRTRAITFISGALLGGIVSAGVAMAAIPSSSDGRITACMKRDGTIRLVDAQAGRRCLSSESTVTWNQTGPAGAQGPAGPSGAQGPAGPAGPPGEAGGGASSYLVDANGTTVGELEAGSNFGAWIVRKAAGYIVYGGDGFPMHDDQLVFESTDCTGQAYVFERGEFDYKRIYNLPYVVNTPVGPTAVAIATPSSTTPVAITVRSQATWSGDGTSNVCYVDGNEFATQALPAVVGPSIDRLPTPLSVRSTP